MSPADNRGRITLRPLGHNRLLALTAEFSPPPAGWERVCEIERGSEAGWLIRHRSSNRLAHLLPTRQVRTLDQRKAQAALDQLTEADHDRHHTGA